MERHLHGATMKHVNRGEFLATEVRLPPLAEQRRVAAILDQADGLRTKRRDTLVALDEVVQSIFVDMFGKLADEHLAVAADVCDRITVGVVIKPASYYVDFGVPALRTLNVRPGKIIESELVYFSHEANEGPLAKSKLRSGDVVVSRTGRAGMAAVVPPQLDGANAIDLIIITPDAERVDSVYLETLLNSQIGTRLVAGEQRGQVQQHFNVGSLKSAKLPIPDLDRQREFSSRAGFLNRLRSTTVQHLAELDALFAALQSRAFAGQLRSRGVPDV